MVRQSKCWPCLLAVRTWTCQIRDRSIHFFLPLLWMQNNSFCPAYFTKFLGQSNDTIELNLLCKLWRNVQIWDLFLFLTFEFLHFRDPWTIWITAPNIVLVPAIKPRCVHQNWADGYCVLDLKAARKKWESNSWCFKVRSHRYPHGVY